MIFTLQKLACWTITFYSFDSLSYPLLSNLCLLTLYYLLILEEEVFLIILEVLSEGIIIIIISNIKGIREIIFSYTPGITKIYRKHLTASFQLRGIQSTRGTPARPSLTYLREIQRALATASWNTQKLLIIAISYLL